MISQDIVKKYHSQLPPRVREYLNNRGIPNDLINQYQLGWAWLYGENWITIPIKNGSGDFEFFKLRQDPTIGDEKMTYPKGGHPQIYDWETLKSVEGKIVICEGEFDRLFLLSKGVPAITATHGASIFKMDWLQEFKHLKRVYICYDNDDAGLKGARKVAEMLFGVNGLTVFNITLPKMGDGKDLTDYFIKFNGSVDYLFDKYAEEILPAEKASRKTMDSNANSFEAKFGPEVAKCGFTQTPNLLLDYQKLLELKDSDLNFSIRLLRYCKNPAKPFSISLLNIIQTSGRSSRTIHNAKDRLIEKGYLNIVGTDKEHKNTKFFDISGLIKKLQELTKKDDSVFKN